MPRKVGSGSTKSPRRKKCRDCDYIPPGKVVSSRCSHCDGVLRVIR